MNETTQQTIVQALRTRILSGELEPGERLVEAQLAERLGISRTPLRYALSVLATEGLVERSGARGHCEFVLLISVSFMRGLRGRICRTSRDGVSGYQKPLRRAGLRDRLSVRKRSEAMNS